MIIKSRVVALGEEFTDSLIVDTKRGSIVINLKVELFKTLVKEYKKLNYKIVHSSSFPESNTVTCVFIKDS